MAGKTDDDDGVLSPEATESLLRLLAGAGRTRLSSAEIDGRAVWIKNFDAERRPLAKKLHALFSPMMLFAFLRSSRAASASEHAAREERKAARLRAAGFEMPAVLYRNGPVLVLSEAADIADRMLFRLRQTDAARHEEMLVEIAGAVGRVHARGLCHGRPHPRDMFRKGEAWGFLDFEEEPEAVMPLAVAQARDVWLLFMQIAGRARNEDTNARAFAAYRAEAPATVLEELRGIVSFFSFFLSPLRMLRPLGLGRDGEVLFLSTSFLRNALRDAERPVTGERLNSKTTEIGTPT